MCSYVAEFQYLVEINFKNGMIKYRPGNVGGEASRDTNSSGVILSYLVLSYII